jgi:hypothetical protein
MVENVVLFSLLFGGGEGQLIAGGEIFVLQVVIGVSDPYNWMDLLIFTSHLESFCERSFFLGFLLLSLFKFL